MSRSLGNENQDSTRGVSERGQFFIKTVKTSGHVAFFPRFMGYRTRASECQMAELFERVPDFRGHHMDHPFVYVPPNYGPHVITDLAETEQRVGIAIPLWTKRTEMLVMKIQEFAERLNLPVTRFGQSLDNFILDG